MNGRRLLLIAAVWLATVVTASSATWAVISATGTRVGQSIPLSAPSSVPSAHTSPTATPTQTPSTEPTKPTSKPTTSKPSHTRPPASPTAEPVTGSWSGEAGTVTASCTRSTVSLVSAVPAVGYRVHVEGGGSHQLEVEFESSTGEDHEVHLKVSCDDGKPVFRRD